MENKETQEQANNRIVKEAFNAVKKDKMPVAEKYARKYGTTDGEASDSEIEELVKKFPGL